MYLHIVELVSKRRVTTRGGKEHFQGYFGLHLKEARNLSMAEMLGDTARGILQWQCPVAPREALVVLYQMMHTVLHWHILMVIEMASKPSVFSSL